MSWVIETKNYQRQLVELAGMPLGGVAVGPSVIERRKQNSVVKLILDQVGDANYDSCNVVSTTRINGECN